MIRAAVLADHAAVAEIVRAAYELYIPRIGKPPGPMLDDYARLIAAGAVSIAELDGAVVALIVLLPKPDHLLLDNIAVRPNRQGRGLGRRLIAFAESEARRHGIAELRLYTHQGDDREHRAVPRARLRRDGTRPPSRLRPRVHDEERLSQPLTCVSEYFP
ncbi:MAG TPA: GNAT family N-acetyltransferase [Stellaceae bacterium]|nr:GNAT family N-acetyltransferase [Stellaceae bacterium]